MGLLRLSDSDANPPPKGDSAVELYYIRILLSLLCLLALASAVYMARAVFLPIVLGGLIWLSLRPATRALNRVGIPHGLSATLLIGGILAALLLMAGALGQQATTLVDRIPSIMDEAQVKLSGVLRSVDEMQQATEQVEQLTDGGEPTREVVVEQPGLVTNVVSSLAGMGSSLLVALVLALFLLASGDLIARRDWAIKSLLRDMEQQVSRYLGAITVINAGLGVAIGLSMAVIGVPYAILWGVAAFLLNFLPFLGALAGVFAVGIVSLVNFDTIGGALVPPLVYLMLTSLEGNIITPLLLGKQLRLNTVAVFLSVVVWVWLWGIAGAFLAVPILIVLNVIRDNLPRDHKWGQLIRGQRAS